MDNRPSLGNARPGREVRGAPPLPNEGAVSDYGSEAVTEDAGSSGAAYDGTPPAMRKPVANRPEATAPDAAAPPPAPPRHNVILRLSAGYWRHKLWTIPLTLLILAAAVLALPATRYPILAFGLKRQYAIMVTDSKTNTPVSGAAVMLDGRTANTDSAGRVSLTARVGKRRLTIRKKYYQDGGANVFVGIAVQHNASSVQLDATGRQVPVVVRNKITGKAVAEATIKVLDTEARTDSQGMATIVLPTTAPSQPATVTANGYSELNVDLQVTDKAVAANTFALTPSGRVYFLSNQSGNIDVVSANLDGSGRKTVLAGTGSEDPYSTVLLASRDWQYLALLSNRDGGKYAKLYLITTNGGRLTTMDETGANFTPVGWSDHVFVYQADRDPIQNWQPGQTALKSYDAETDKTAGVDQTNAAGTETQYVYQRLAFVNIVGSRVVYGFAWNDNFGNYEPNRLGGQKDVILSADTDGTGKKTLREMPIANGVTYSYMTAVLYQPEVLYIQTSAGAQPAVYYTYQYDNNSVTQSSTLTDASYAHAQQNYTTYLISPGSKATFWTQQRDGKNTLFVGDYDGSSGTQIASLSEYSPYGWFTDSYLLVQKGNNELYIMPAAGGTPLKVSDYYRPSRSFYGYGGGYGGL